MLRFWKVISILARDVAEWRARSTPEPQIDDEAWNALTIKPYEPDAEPELPRFEEFVETNPGLPSYKRLPEVWNYPYLDDELR